MTLAGGAMAVMEKGAIESNKEIDLVLCSDQHRTMIVQRLHTGDRGRQGGQERDQNEYAHEKKAFQHVIGWSF